MRGAFFGVFLFLAIGTTETRRSAHAESPRNEAPSSPCEDQSEDLGRAAFARYPWRQLRGHGELLWLRFRMRQDRDWQELSEARVRQEAELQREEERLTAEREELRFAAFQVYGPGLGRAKSEVLDLIDRGEWLAQSRASSSDPASRALLRFMRVDLQSELHQRVRELRSRYDSTMLLRAARLRLRALYLENALKMIPNDKRDRAIQRTREKIKLEESHLASAAGADPELEAAIDAQMRERLAQIEQSL